MNNLPTIEQPSGPAPCCNKSKWPNLNNLCIEHYDEFVVQPARLVYEALETEYFRLRNELYKAEVAAGLRPRAVVDWLAQGTVSRIDFLINEIEKELARRKESDEPIKNDI